VVGALWRFLLKYVAVCEHFGLTCNVHAQGGTVSINSLGKEEKQSKEQLK
jgi:hypothetical protein